MSTRLLLGSEAVQISFELSNDDAGYECRVGFMDTLNRAPSYGVVMSKPLEFGDRY